MMPYNEWEFVYDVSKDRARGLPALLRCYSGPPQQPSTLPPLHGSAPARRHPTDATALPPPR